MNADKVTQNMQKREELLSNAKTIIDMAPRYETEIGTLYALRAIGYALVAIGHTLNNTEPTEEDE